MKHTYLSALILVIWFFSCSEQKQTAPNPFDPVAFVNPQMGTAVNVQLSPGPATPWGLITVTPNNTSPRTDNESLYRFGESFMYGLAHIPSAWLAAGETSHLSIMPVTGEPVISRKARRSTYQLESAKAGRYRVHLKKWNTFVEATATTRTAFTIFRLPEGKSHLIFNLASMSGNNIDGFLNIVSPIEMEGYMSANVQETIQTPSRVYFAVQFSQSAWDYRMTENGLLLNKDLRAHSGSNIGAYLSFTTREAYEIHVKIGFSFVSIENAWKNLVAEQGRDEFDDIVKKSQTLWKDQLSKVMVYGGSDAEKTLFYTSLYHALLYPNISDDADGQFYDVLNQQIASLQSGHRFSIPAYWIDAHTHYALLSTLYPRQFSRLLQTLADGLAEKPADMYRVLSQSGCPGNGLLAPLLLEASTKDDIEFDLETAYNAAVGQLNDSSNESLRAYSNTGYVPYNREFENASVSATLQYAYADGALARLAQLREESDTATYHLKRSSNFENVFNSESGFFQPRLPDGRFLESFHPTNGLRFQDDENGFCYGSAWNWAFFAPHRPRDLPDLHGSSDKMIAKIDKFMKYGYFLFGYRSNLGVPYLYNYFENQEWRTSDVVRDVLASGFAPEPFGHPTRQQPENASSWLVWSMLGLYPDYSYAHDYHIISPVFERVEIMRDRSLVPQQTFVIRNEKSTGSDMYIKAIKLNNEPLNRPFLDHSDFSKGGVLTISTSQKR